MSSFIETRTTLSPALPPQSPDLDEVPSHRPVAVLCALLCFAPLGIAAVVYAGNVRTMLALGDVDGARHASRIAKRLCWASFAVTMACLLVIVVGVWGNPDGH